MKKCMHKIENMPLQTPSIFSRPGQMSQSTGACFSSKILAGSAKFANVPPPGLTRRANAPQKPGGGGGGLLVEAGID